ncbi:MAG: Smr/MutS family protein, partial [Gemmatimonadota bacterium]|nr:Smr/MutS family protein [Gemmatimonadota bacterium]
AALLGGLRTLVRIDTLLARGRYARSVEAHRPVILAAGSEEYTVVRGFHPLLLGRGEPVVPFDLVMEPGERTLLISGPNTGGKTVLLKAIGLISLLAQSGVFPPVGRGTRLPIFRDVHADIGDEQSIEASLSTFSAHLKNLGETLLNADFQSLVLTDEIGSGTDPLEGGALAAAILMELTRRSAFTVATSHLGQLKLLAGEQGGIVNASLHFDAERMRPTFRLAKGIPGRSYGLAIARRLGLPEAVLGMAESLLPEGERDIARLLLDLEAKEMRLTEASDALAGELDATRALREELERREAALARGERDAERRAREQTRDLLLGARGEVEAAIRELRETHDSAALEEGARAARRRVEEAAARQKERTPRERSRHRSPPAGEVSLEAGVRVRIESLGRTGVVVELRDEKVMVEAGSLRILLPREELTVLAPGDQTPTPRRSPALVGGYASSGDVARPEVDLRGIRVDELELLLGRALDDAILAGLPTFRVIHGKGTGALRERVRELLRADPRVSDFRAGDLFEGGTGVTVAEFA